MALQELAERARLTGDHGTALLTRDAGEAVFALVDRLAWVRRKGGTSAIRPA
ncbi:hypothetical protein [Heyndrickxia sporothermodurans]